MHNITLVRVYNLSLSFVCVYMGYVLRNSDSAVRVVEVGMHYFTIRNIMGTQKPICVPWFANLEHQRKLSLEGNWRWNSVQYRHCAQGARLGAGAGASSRGAEPFLCFGHLGCFSGPPLARPTSAPDLPPQPGAGRVWVFSPEHPSWF